jgi:lipopolysaccharide biosynthesis regulator YciM
MKELLDVLLEPDGCGSVMYKDQSYKDSVKKWETVQKASIQYLDALLDLLEMTFPDAGVLDKFSVLAPYNAARMNPQEATSKLVELLDYVEKNEMGVSKNEALQEWKIVYYIINKHPALDLEVFGFIHTK